MTLFRNKKDKTYKTYYLARCYCAGGFRLLGSFYESVETLSGKRRKLNNSSHKYEDFYAVAEK